MCYVLMRIDKCSVHDYSLVDASFVASMWMMPNQQKITNI